LRINMSRVPGGISSRRVVVGLGDIGCLCYSIDRLCQGKNVTAF
jgi:hypothetical protein